MDLFFYDVDADYVKYLKTTETAKRGFTRVPDVEYKNERKMVCGVVLEMNGYKYYVPVSSYKKKQPNNLLIRLEDDTFNQVKGSLHFNYMFPVDDYYISKRDFNKETPPIAVENNSFNSTISIPHIGQRYTFNPTISIPPIGQW